jgi:hypothetical protein
VARPASPTRLFSLKQVRTASSLPPLDSAEDSMLKSWPDRSLPLPRPLLRLLERSAKESGSILRFLQSCM